MYSKRLQIDANLDIGRALNCLDHFIGHYLDSHVGRNHPVVYGGDPGRQTVVIYQTDKSFIVRKG